MVDAVLVGTERDIMRHRATNQVRGHNDVLSLSAALTVLRVVEERCDPRRSLRCGDHLHGVRSDGFHVHSQPVFSVPTAHVEPVDSFLERGEDHRAWFVDGWEFRSAREVHLQDVLSTLVEPDDVTVVSRHDGTLSLFGGEQLNVADWSFYGRPFSRINSVYYQTKNWKVRGSQLLSHASQNLEDR